MGRRYSGDCANRGEGRRCREGRNRFRPRAEGSDRKAVGYGDLQRVMSADGVTVEAGICCATGYGQAVMDMAGKPDPEILHHQHSALDVRHERLCRWIDESQISVLVADNFGVEAFPYADLGETDRYPGLPIHQECLFELGIHLGELWYLSALAAHLRPRKRSRFLLTAPPLACRLVRLAGDAGRDGIVRVRTEKRRSRSPIWRG